MKKQTKKDIMKASRYSHNLMNVGKNFSKEHQFSSSLPTNQILSREIETDFDSPSPVQPLLEPNHKSAGKDLNFEV